jgi:hypothetical protein
MKVPITDPETGRIVEVEVEGDAPLTPAEQAEILFLLKGEAPEPAAAPAGPSFGRDLFNRGAENVVGLAKGLAGLTPLAFLQGKAPGQEMAEGMARSIHDTLTLQSPGVQKVGAAIGRGAPTSEVAIRGAAAGIDPIIPVSEAVDALYAGRPGIAAADALTAIGTTAAGARFGPPVAQRVAGVANKIGRGVSATNRVLTRPIAARPAPPTRPGPAPAPVATPATADFGGALHEFLRKQGVDPDVNHGQLWVDGAGAGFPSPQATPRPIQMALDDPMTVLQDAQQVGPDRMGLDFVRNADDPVLPHRSMVDLQGEAEAALLARYGNPGRPFGQLDPEHLARQAFANELPLEVRRAILGLEQAPAQVTNFVARPAARRRR